MQRWIVLLLTMIIVTGCSAKELTEKEMNLDALDSDVKSFFIQMGDTNGAHLFQDKGERIYVYLNGATIIQGEKAQSFSNFHVKSEGQTLEIFYDKHFVDDFSKKEINNQLIYEINFDKEYETLSLFENGEETSFGTITGR